MTKRKNAFIYCLLLLSFLAVVTVFSAILSAPSYTVAEAAGHNNSKREIHAFNWTKGWGLETKLVVYYNGSASFKERTAPEVSFQLDYHADNFYIIGSVRLYEGGTEVASVVKTKKTTRRHFSATR